MLCDTVNINNRVGTFIEKDTLRIGVALRVGLTVCIPHRCKCWSTVDAFMTYFLSCRFSAGRLPRHSALIDVAFQQPGCSNRLVLNFYKLCFISLFDCCANLICFQHCFIFTFVSTSFYCHEINGATTI